MKIITPYLLAAAATSWLACGILAQAPLPTSDVTVELRPIVTGGLRDLLIGNTQNARRQVIPIDMTPLGDGRQLVYTLAGHMRLLDQDGNLAPGAYLDTRDPARPFFEVNFIELGQTSIAAHPGFSDPASRGFGKIYTLNSELVQGVVPADFDDGVASAYENVLYEWSILNPAQNIQGSSFQFLGPNPTVTRREIIRSRRPGIIHGIFDMAFSPDEYIVMCSGDGGGNSVPPGSSFLQSRERTALNPRSVFGSMLRIDPLDLPGDTRALGANGQYRIHPENIGQTDSDSLTPPETLAYGIRSPYRMSIDSVTGTIYFGDVGEANREEINQLQVDGSGAPIETDNSGVNFGWGRFEGTRFNSNISNGIGGRPFVDPLFELFHSIGGQSEAVNVVGGLVYRGSAFPELVGKYVFTGTGEDEFTQPSNVLDLFVGDPTNSSADSRDDLFRLPFQMPAGVAIPDRIWSLAEDEEGELYALVGPRRGLDFMNPFNDDPTGTEAGIYKIVPTCPSGVGGSSCATVGDLGGGCANSSGSVASLGSPTDAFPVIGAAWDLDLSAAPVGASVFVTLGLSNLGGVDLSILMAPGCLLYSDLSLAVPFVADSLGQASLTIAVPSDIPVGFSIIGQAVILDPGLNPLGLALSDALNAQTGLN